jgi:hypothetical protein
MYCIILLYYITLYYINYISYYILLYYVNINYAEVLVAMHNGPMSSYQMHIIFLRFYQKLEYLGICSVRIVKKYIFFLPLWF